MKIGINCLGMLGDRTDGGVAYTRNLVYGLSEYDENNDYYLFVDKHDCKSFIDINSHRFMVIPVETKPSQNLLFRGLRKALRLAKIRMPQTLFYQAKQYGIDLIYHAGCMDLTLDIPGIACIYDIQHEYHPERFPVSAKWRKQGYQDYVNKAVHIVTISNYSKNTILEKYNVGSEKVSVVHIAAAARFCRLPASVRNEVKLKYNLPDRFLFYPASFFFHKNHIFLLEAFAELRDKYEHLSLVFTGNTFRDHPDSSYHEVVKKINELGLSKRVRILECLPAHAMPAIYNLASLMVFPSLFEGFGIPIIEAMACGCPVACSNVTALPEVAGEAALYFDPLRKDSLINAVLRILSEMDLKDQLVKHGFNRAKRFSQEKFAKSLVSVFEKVGGEVMRSSVKIGSGD